MENFGQDKFRLLPAMSNTTPQRRGGEAHPATSHRLPPGPPGGAAAGMSNTVATSRLATLQAPGIISGAYTTALKGNPMGMVMATDYETQSINGTGGSIGVRQQPSASSRKTLAYALLPDLPLLMHGSGDVLPQEVHPQSVATLAQLIEKYVASLVSAAIDAHDVFTDGEVVGGGACLGIPPFSDSTRGVASDDEDDGEMAKHKSNGRGKSSNRKKQKIDYWDVPLSPPWQDDEDGDSTNTSDGSDLSSDDSDDDAPLLRRLSSSASAACASTNTAESRRPPSSRRGQPPLGVAPLDLHSSDRVRSHYVSAPTAMDARSFIFPVCHDAFLYQRIKEVQAARRALRRDVLDPTLMVALGEEGSIIGRWGVADMLDAVLSSRANEDEVDEVRGFKKGSLGDSGKAQDGGKDKCGAADKKPEATYQEKCDDNNGRSNNSVMVGAGLLDPNVDPSWPGLDAFMRGRLW